ncbi:MAG: ATP-dependent DNA helicase RecG [Ilumatobacter sp.]|nr:ATP-dependent DNA helicase RecG [bacterium]NKB40233.1 ATP-dependent DNA helicase RecG [Ilumatobacter sp.]
MSEPITLRDLVDIPVERLKGVGPKKQASLVKIGITDLLDLVTNYPRRWVDRTNEARIADLVPGEEALVLVTVRSVNKRATRNRRTIVNVNVGDGSGRMDLVFFNQPWRERQLKEGLQIALFGKADTYRGGLQMSNPIVDLIGDRTGRIVPIYPQSEKAQINTWEMASWIEETLRRCEERGIADPVPSAVLCEYKMISRSDALAGIHLPEDMKQKEMARRRLAFDELLRVQLVLVLRKRALERDQRGFKHATDGDLVRRFYDSLPYPLTGAQERAIGEIFVDLANGHPMHRLLQGDVGAGKTVVSVAAMLVGVQSGHQAALMAPTEVLAEQHAASVRLMLDGVTVPDPANLFGDRPLRVELLTNRVTGAARKDILEGLADGSVDIAIGTHALIQNAVDFSSLGVVVVDEQHRFGVEQRSALRDKAADGQMPDTLVMTATPIPRTAAMTVYGDLDVSVLDELPPGRTPIVTMWANGPLMETAVWRDICDEVQAGRQAYVVCPLVGESEKLEIASAEETRERLARDELSGLRLGLLHGKMQSDEKEATMDRFRAGEIDVLVATTVIEVGVDVPNATVMAILDADRFGIAQLHQLRGRVGRGEHASTCWLITQQREDGDEGNPRVEALVETTDGFALAEVDLELRGEGTLMSTSQKGRSDLKLASLRRDRNLVEMARRAAFVIVDADQDLVNHPLIADEVDLMFSDRDEEFLTKS